jgi:hypothetical protein
MVVTGGRGAGGKFAKGHHFARGNPLNRLAQAMKANAIRHARGIGAVPQIFDQLLADATDPLAPGIVRVAAAKLYLGYVLGPPEKTLNVVKTDGTARPMHSVEQQAAILERLGVPLERWPVMAKEYRRKQVEATVTTPPTPASR